MTRSKKMTTKTTMIQDKIAKNSTPHIENILNFINWEKNGNANNRILSPATLKIYKSLGDEDKEKIAIHTAEIIRNCYFKNQDFKINIFKFTILFSGEKDWLHIKLFLEFLLHGPVNLDLTYTICKNIFSILDKEFSSENLSENIPGACLALISEIGMYVRNSTEKAPPLLKNKYLSFLDYLTSNMIARSNINSETMRIALVYYFSKVEPFSQIHKQRILTRFGQSLLEHVLNTYFSHSKKSGLAFYFILKHLNDFITSSPAIAEMSNSVLQNQMLRHTDEFPLLIKRYISHNLKDLNYDKSRSLIIHLSFLLKEACEINQKNLVESLLEIILSYIHLFENKANNSVVDLYEILGEVVSLGKSPKAKEISNIIFDKILSSKKAIDSANVYKLIHLESRHRNLYSKTENHIDELKPSPLEEILLLAS